MTILYGFKRDEQGRIMDRLFDHDKMPPDWHDSPSKVPPVEALQIITPPPGELYTPKRRGRPPKVTHG